MIFGHSGRISGRKIIISVSFTDMTSTRAKKTLKGLEIFTVAAVGAFINISIFNLISF
jgi:hypothetical protein